MRTARAVAGSKCQKKFGTIYHFDVKLMWSRCASRAHLPPRHGGNEAQCAEKKSCPDVAEDSNSGLLKKQKTKKNNFEAETHPVQLGFKNDLKTRTFISK